MRVGLIASLAGHTAVLLWGLIAFPDAGSFTTPPVDSLPVELVPLEDLTRLQKGEKDAEIREVAAVKPTEKPKEEPVKPADKPEKAAVEQPTPPTPAPAPAPTPEPEPTPVAEPEPAPAPAPQAAAEPEPAPAEKAPEPAPEAAAPEPIQTKVVPRVKPKPPRPTQTAEKPKEKDFKPNEIAALLNKVEPKGSSSSSKDPASLGSRLAEKNEGLSASEMDLLISKIKQRFNSYGDDYPDDLVITLQFSLDQNGRLEGSPQVLNSYPHPKFDALARAAVRAVHMVDQQETFAFLPRDKFGGAGGWNTVVVNFYPKQR